ncbi:Sodium/proline symporter [compost metagenome]
MGAITVVVWKHFSIWGLYEIIPGFILGALAIYFVSRAGNPSKGMVSRFEAADEAFKAGR